MLASAKLVCQRILNRGLTLLLLTGRIYSNEFNSIMDAYHKYML